MDNADALRRSWKLRAVLIPISVALGLSFSYPNPAVSVLLIVAVLFVLTIDCPYFQPKATTE